VLDNVRNGIWLELWGNLTFNPIRALTHATLADNFLYRLGRGLAVNRMCEAQALAVKLGASFRVSLEKGIEGGNNFSGHVHCGSPGLILGLTAGVRWMRPPLLATCP
jgi:2-dehydropantoate 2-reductase